MNLERLLGNNYLTTLVGKNYNTTFLGSNFQTILLGNNQTWKKLQAVQAALADILSEITLFWGHFESNILYFWVRMEKEELISKQIDLF